METTLIKCSNNLLPTIDNLRIHNDKYDQISCSLYLSHNKDESKKKLPRNLNQELLYFNDYTTVL